MNSIEHTLIEQLKRGDNQAVRTWFAQYHATVLRFVSSKIESTADAEEITQETFVHCLKTIALFTSSSSLKTWMYSVARHEIADYYRKKYAKKAIRTLSLQQALVGETIADAHDISERVKAVLHQMRHDYAELLQLKYIDGKAVRAIAQELRRTVKSVEADLFRARQDFRMRYALSES